MGAEYHRLVAGVRQILNCQPAVRQGNAGLGPYPVAVRAAVLDALRHA